MSAALVAIGWFLLLVLSAYIVGAFYGNRDLVNMFPEGRRWWMPCRAHAVVWPVPGELEDALGKS